jgi:hypothetical protein
MVNYHGKKYGELP